MKSKKLRPIVLAGGLGKRLWPLSTDDEPKQFIPLFGDYSLFDLTLQRLNKSSLFKSPIIITSEKYLKYVQDSIKRTGVESEKIILEPVSKNTYPAILVSVSIALLKNKDEDFLVVPSDHYIKNNQSFHEACLSIIEEIQSEGLMLFGVKPDRPSVDYGYIESKGSNDSIRRVYKFIEKPDSKKAEVLLEKPHIYWNAGMFSFNGSWLMKTSKEVNNNLYKQIEDLIEKKHPIEHCVYLNTEKFKGVQSVSFDKGFVEKNIYNYFTLLDAGWSDLGSWVSLGAMQVDPESKMSIFFNEKADKVERPWGHYEILMETETSKVKSIRVLPGHKLSLQKHRHRSETWYVVKGIAKVTKGGERFTMHNGDSIVINKNETHRLENASNENLEIIEIQTGTYFGEDDIVRIQDVYGRADLH